MCVHQYMNYVLDNLWCSNSKNLCVFILYGVFHPFSSMLPIVHVQSIYNMNKSVTTICMIFVDFFRFFLTLQAPNPTESVLFKTGLVNQQNRSVYHISVWFIDLIQNFQRFKFCTGFAEFRSNRLNRSGFQPSANFSIPKP
jgi:hypothetical protein